MCFRNKSTTGNNLALRKVSVKNDCKLVNFQKLLVSANSALRELKIDLRYYEDLVGFESSLKELTSLYKLKLVVFHSERWHRLFQMAPEQLVELTLVATSHVFCENINQIVAA